MVRGIAALLAPDGVFVVQAIYLGGMVQNTAFDQVYHEHLCYYTLRSLSALLELHGLEVFEASMVPIHGGPSRRMSRARARARWDDRCTPCAPPRARCGWARSIPIVSSRCEYWHCATDCADCWSSIAHVTGGVGLWRTGKRRDVVEQFWHRS